MNIPRRYVFKESQKHLYHSSHVYKESKAAEVEERVELFCIKLKNKLLGKKEHPHE